jgi:hypothetical protein
VSLIQELGARLRATSDELPTGPVTVALEKLRSATELLMWVRQESVDPLGVPLLGNALEHAERAAAALRVAQDAIAAYVFQLGLVAEATPPDGGWKAGLDQQRARPRPGPDAPANGDRRRPSPEKLGPWWQQRVAELTGEPPPKPEEIAARHPSTTELLRRVATDVRTGDRARLGRDLHHVDAATGLGLSAVTPPVMHRLAGDLLGHEPRPEDLNRLRTAVAARVRSLLPGTSAASLDTLLARICRAPAPSDAPLGHPADNAVTASVLTGVLLARLGRDHAALDPAAPDPAGPDPAAPEPLQRRGADA